MIRGQACDDAQSYQLSFSPCPAERPCREKHLRACLGCLLLPQSSSHRVEVFHEIFKNVSVVFGRSCSIFADEYLSFSLKRCVHHEGCRAPMTNVLAVLSFRPARGCLDRRTRRLQELLAELVQTDKGIIIALRPLVNRQYFFHASNKLCVGFRWDAPATL